MSFKNLEWEMVFIWPKYEKWGYDPFKKYFLRSKASNSQ